MQYQHGFANNIANNRRITLLIVFTAIGSVISGVALLSCYEVAAQQAGSNSQLSLSVLRKQYRCWGAHQLILL
jgi:hypothetical protein